MENVKMRVEKKAGKDILIIEVDLTQDLGPSSSGKTTIIGTTGGNQPAPGATNGAIVGLNVYKKR